MNNFNAGGGIELPDLCDPIAFQKFKSWDGNSYNIQHLDVKFISKSYLGKVNEETNMKVE